MKRTWFQLKGNALANEMCVFNVLLAAIDKSVFQLWRVFRKFSNKINSFYKETSQIKNNDQTLDISCIKGLTGFLCFENTNHTIWWSIIIENVTNVCQGFKEILILIHLTPSRYDHWCDDWLFGLKVEDNLSKAANSGLSGQGVLAVSLSACTRQRPLSWGKAAIMIKKGYHLTLLA